MSKKLVLIGGGGHCKSVLDAVHRCNEYDNVVITDPKLTPGTVISGCKVAGSDDLLSTLFQEGYCDAFITVGNILSDAVRENIAKRINHIGFVFPVIIDPSATVSETVVIGEGTFIGKSAVINTDAKIGSHCIINTGAIVEHECIVGDFSHISVGTILCGNVEIGDESLIGAGSVVIQGKKIGDKAMIGAGSIVTRDMPNNTKAYGNPCRVVE